MNEPARTVCNVKLEMENGLLGLVEFVEIHTDPPRWRRGASIRLTRETWSGRYPRQKCSPKWVYL